MSGMSQAWAIGASLVELEVETGVAHNSVNVVPHQVAESSRILVTENATQVLGASSQGAQFMG